MRDYGSTVREAHETLCSVLDAVEHVAPGEILRSPELGDCRAILASDLAKLVADWPDWAEVVAAEVSTGAVVWAKLHCGGSVNVLALAEVPQRQLDLGHLVTISVDGFPAWEPAV